MMKKFKECYENRHDYVKNWKEKNPDGKVLGYFCTYVPEEILYATKILPVLYEIKSPISRQQGT